MAKFNGWKNKYSYLDDYKKGLDGKYVYYGHHYILKNGGSTLFRKLRAVFGITDILLIALYIISGCTNAGKLWNTWYVIIPFAIEVILIFLTVYKSLSLITEKYPVKEHEYKKSFPWVRPCLYILAAVSIVSACMAGLCMILNPDDVITSGCIIYIILHLAMAAVCVVCIGMIRSAEWEPDPSEIMEE